MKRMIEFVFVLSLILNFMLGTWYLVKSKEADKDPFNKININSRVEIKFPAWHGHPWFITTTYKDSFGTYWMPMRSGKTPIMEVTQIK